MLRARGLPRPADRLPHPGRVIGSAFAAAIAVGTVLLWLPVARTDGTRPEFVDALFTATSSVCVTGLASVDTGTYWSTYGLVVILLLVQVGGLGIMTLASLVAIVLSRRLGFRAQLLAQAETNSLTSRDIARVVRNVVLFSLAVELVGAAALTARFRWGYDEGLGDAAWSGLFHSMMSFNHAGFSLHPDSFVRYVTDPWVSTTVAVIVIVGSLGFPVVFELCREWRRPRIWSVLTRLTVGFTVALLVVGTLGMLAGESTNDKTLGPLGGWQRMVAAFFASAMTRSAGLNSIDMADVRPESLFLTDVLMFIGGGSASTAGGIKVTTFGVLAYVLLAEMRGDPDVEVGRRRIPVATQRQALSVALITLGVVVMATMTMLVLTELTLDVAVFETISAFSTTGLSTGVTAGLRDAAKVLLIALMYLGRIGPLTLASGLALRERKRLHRLPEERIIVG